MSLLKKTTAFDALVQRHHLSILEEPPDLALETGDLKLTRDNDLFLGSDDAYNGMHRLAVAWAYGSPTMQMLFNALVRLREERPSLSLEMERALQDSNPFVPGRSEEERASALQGYHIASDALDAGEVGCGVLSGCLMITIQSMLGRFQADLKLKPSAAEWSGARPTVNGISIGRLVTAAANAFRHADEWAEALAQKRVTDQQRASMDVLSVAVPPTEIISHQRSWERALKAMGGESFEQLGAVVLSFAHEVALGVRCGRP